MMNLVYRFIIFILIIIPTSLFSKEPKEELLKEKEIIAKTIQFKGIDALNKIEKIAFKGQITEQGSINNSFDFYFLKPDLYRFKSLIGNMPFNLIEKSDSVWIKYQQNTIKNDNPINVERVNILKSIIRDDFYKNYKNYKLIENQKINNTDCYHFKHKEKNSSREYFISRDDFRIVKSTYEADIAGEVTKCEIYFDKYIQNKEIRFPSEVEAFIGDKIIKLKIELINYDLELNEYDFK